MRTARRAALAAVGIELVVLLATGIWLYFNYRPSASQAWQDMFPDADTGVQGIRVVHRVASTLLLWTSVVAGVLLVVGPRLHRLRRLVPGLLLVLFAAVGGITGYLLPWDQLALWAVKVGSNYDGFGALLGDEIRFVIIGGVEVSPTAIIRWLGVHVAIGIAGFGTAVWAWRRSAPPPVVERSTES